MKLSVAIVLLFGAFFLVLTGMPLQLLHMSPVEPAYANIDNSWSNDWDQVRVWGTVQSEYNGDHKIQSWDIEWNKIWGQDDIWEKAWNKVDDKDRFWSKDDTWDKFQGFDKDRDKIPDHDWDHEWGKHHDHDDGCGNKKVPEPGMFSLLSAGIAGVGIYSIMRRGKSN